jgi:hypothetical protein
MAEIATSGHRRLTPDNKSSRDLNEDLALREMPLMYRLPVPAGSQGAPRSDDCRR